MQEQQAKKVPPKPKKKRFTLHTPAKRLMYYPIELPFQEDKTNRDRKSPRIPTKHWKVQPIKLALRQSQLNLTWLFDRSTFKPKCSLPLKLLSLSSVCSYLHHLGESLIIACFSFRTDNFFQTAFTQNLFSFFVSFGLKNHTIFDSTGRTLLY